MTQQLVLLQCESNGRLPQENKRLTVRQLARELNISASLAHRYLLRGMPPFAEAARIWKKENIKEGEATYTQIAKAIGVSRQMAFKHVCRGCPTTSIADAVKWYEENVKNTKRSANYRASLNCFADNADQINASPSPGYVYLLIEENSPFVKIGFSSNRPHHRASGCQVGNPRQIFLLHFRKHKYARTIERRLHLKFLEHRKSGEWFDVPVWRVLKELDSIPQWIGWASNNEATEEVAA